MYSHRPYNSPDKFDCHPIAKIALPYLTSERFEKKYDRRVLIRHLIKNFKTIPTPLCVAN